MTYDEIYQKNFEVLEKKETLELLDIFFHSQNPFLRCIARDVIVKDNRLDNFYIMDIIQVFIDRLELEDLWIVAGSGNSDVSKIAMDRLSIILDEVLHTIGDTGKNEELILS